MDHGCLVFPFVKVVHLDLEFGLCSACYCTTLPIPEFSLLNKTAFNYNSFHLNEGILKNK